MNDVYIDINGKQHFIEENALIWLLAENHVFISGQSFARP